MPDYSKGKIYKLCVGENDIYVGATCNTLVKRKHDHKLSSKKYPNRRLYKKCIEVGFDNVDIVLIERFKCDNKDDLHKKEREWIDKISTLNIQKPGRTDHEWYEDNKDKVKLRGNRYRKNNKESIRLYRKQYRENNKEKLKEKIKCKCGCMISKINIKRHTRTNKHKKLILLGDSKEVPSAQ